MNPWAAEHVGSIREDIQDHDTQNTGSGSVIDTTRQELSRLDNHLGYHLDQNTSG